MNDKQIAYSRINEPEDTYQCERCDREGISCDDLCEHTAHTLCFDCCDSNEHDYYMQMYKDDLD